MSKKWITLKELPGIPLFTVGEQPGISRWTKFESKDYENVEKYPDFFAPLLEEASGFKVGDKVSTGQLKGILVKGLYKSKYGIVLVVDVNGLTKVFHEDYVVKVPTLPTTMEEVQKLVYCNGTDERYAKELAYSKLLEIADSLNGDWNLSPNTVVWEIYCDKRDNSFHLSTTSYRSSIAKVVFKTKELAQHVIEHFSDVLKQLI